MSKNDDMRCISYCKNQYEKSAVPNSVPPYARARAQIMVQLIRFEDPIRVHGEGKGRGKPLPEGDEGFYFLIILESNP